MNCYVCAQEGKETPGIAVCLACGMCVCNDHLVREDMPLEDVKKWGFSIQKTVLAEKMPRILCKLCHTALNQ